jgi:PEGA domain
MSGSVQPDPMRPPTVPAAPPPAVAEDREPLDRRVVIAVAVAAALILLMLGLVIGRLTASGGRVIVEKVESRDAQLVVTSKPVEANVIVDGRFVGVSPVERLDLDAGKHSIVIDAFGYQPYAGSLEVEPKARMSLKVVLAPLGGGSGSRTIGELAGKGGKGSESAVPPSALAPVSMTGTGAGKDAPKKPAGGRGGYSAPVSAPSTPSYEPPPRPRRDCSGEKSQCRDSCSRANGDCRFNCPNCVSCPSSVGWDECNRQCNTCRGGCEQNVKFCESSCDSSYSSCSASQ